MHDLLQFDIWLFLKIHRDMSNGFLDVFLPLMRNRFFWIPLYLFIIVFCIKKYKKTGIYIIGGALLTFAIGDLTASRIIKPSVDRLRPCNEPSLATEIIHRVTCGSGKSFPSAHATNHFGIAMYFTLVFYRKWKYILPISMLWAAVISFAQIYVGVHYPLDVLCGTLLGLVIGSITFYIFNKIKPSF